MGAWQRFLYFGTGEGKKSGTVKKGMTGDEDKCFRKNFKKGGSSKKGSLLYHQSDGDERMEGRGDFAKGREEYGGENLRTKKRRTEVESGKRPRGSTLKRNKRRTVKNNTLL